jgi:hypothetical protein
MHFYLFGKFYVIKKLRLLTMSDNEDDIFGLSDEERASVPAASIRRSKSPVDNEDIFEDSDSDQSKQKTQHAKLKRGRIAKRKKAKVEENSEKQLKRRTKLKSDLPNENGGDDSSDDEASEEEFQEHDKIPQKQKAENVSKQKAKGDDPLSLMLLETKRIKAKQLTDEEKVKIVETLIRKMENAAKLDEEDVKNGKPAMQKLSLRESVEQAVSMASLHQTLLEHDGSRFLIILKEWISPFHDNKDVLPNLTLRTAIYKMLASLPCKTEELKISEVGKVLVKLRNHPREIPANKLLLKNIIEKWNRIILPSSNNFSGPESLGLRLGKDIQCALAQQYKHMGSNSLQDKKQDSIIPEGQIVVKDASERARAPISNGYMFTVGLEELGPHQSIFGSKQPAGITTRRDMIVKKLQEISNGGKKSNLRLERISLIIIYDFFRYHPFIYRAVDSSVSGKNIKL